MSIRFFCILGFALVFSGCAHRPPAAQQPAVAHWTFDGDLSDRTGRGNDANAESPVFTAGHAGRGLRCGANPLVVPDGADLRLAPGLRVECWVRLTSLPTEGQSILTKGDEYLLRVDPAEEGGQISFFVYLDGWEPRVRSKAPPKVGVWYHLVGTWDGKEISLQVNGDEVRGPRSGTPMSKEQPIRIGPVAGVIDEARIENPNAGRSAVASWPFDGDLRDASGNGHDVSAEGARFAPGRCGQALQSGSEQVLVPSRPDLQLAPGLRIDCSVCFDNETTGCRHIVIKDGEYLLRVNPPKEGGQFAFFVNLDGSWEPHVDSDRRAKPGVWYRVIAKWDGISLTIEVNGEKSRVFRSGLARPGDKPLVIGALGGLIDHLGIENPRLPFLRVQAVTQAQAILRAGRPEKLTAVIQSIGADAAQVEACLELPTGVTCPDSAVRQLGTMPSGATKTVEWTVQADAEMTVAARVRLTAQGCAAVTTGRTLAFFPLQDRPAAPPIVAHRTPGPKAVTYYIDSAKGSNANSGASPDAPWQDFTNVNGKTLGPGDRLLIKRGSVINQELSVSARGAAEDWAEIGTYGAGPRPIIRRNWDIGDRCVLVRDPDFLRISSLVVCYAGKGLVVCYRKNGRAGLVIEDCIAHHIEGLYRPNAHGIPEWRDRGGAEGDGFDGSAGIAIVGALAKDLLVRNCEMFQTSQGFRVGTGDAVTVDRVYCHDNYVHNTSPHPFLCGAWRSYLQNSVFDASGWHASAGTMGIMLGNPQGLIIRNCTFRNQPDSGSHDEGGIDFENLGNGCLIDHCTFENNAGAAIEVLGLKSPQPRNVEIMNSRFIKNNWVKKNWGPAEIYIWGKAQNPEVCCSTGTIHDNGYVLNPGVQFFVNEAPKTTSWTLRDNIGYTTVEELEKAMSFNRPPMVEAGPDIRTDSRSVRLAGRVGDDGKPGNGPTVVKWEVLEGPGAVTFQSEGASETTANFSVPGDYLLRLVGDDGELWLSDMVAVHILPPGVSVARAWEFNKPLDKEGWTEVNPGTRVQEWKDQKWPAKSEPVKYVGGGYYILAVEKTTDAHLLSPDSLDIDLNNNKTIKIRFQNHTPATRMRVKFTTVADETWDDAKGKTFDVVANDAAPREYAVDMSTVPGWTGRLKQLRLDLATGEPLTGTCRFDYIWIGQ
ncbi:MAG: LamG-like jellyroll fold domain-containing protein [Planctomycetota bacterium]